MAGLATPPACRLPTCYNNRQQSAVDVQHAGNVVKGFLAQHDGEAPHAHPVIRGDADDLPKLLEISSQCLTPDLCGDLVHGNPGPLSASVLRAEDQIPRYEVSIKHGDAFLRRGHQNVPHKSLGPPDDPLGRKPQGRQGLEDNVLRGSTNPPGTFVYHED